MKFTLDIYNCKQDISKSKVSNSFFGAVMQIAFIDFVFSFDSIINSSRNY